MKYGNADYASLYELCVARFTPNKFPEDYTIEKKGDVIRVWHNYWRELCGDKGVLRDYWAVSSSKIRKGEVYVAVSIRDVLPQPPKVVRLKDKWITRGYVKYEFSTFDSEACQFSLTGLRFFQPIERINKHV